MLVRLANLFNWELAWNKFTTFRLFSIILKCTNICIVFVNNPLRVVFTEWMTLFRVNRIASMTLSVIGKNLQLLHPDNPLRILILATCMKKFCVVFFICSSLTLSTLYSSSHHNKMRINFTFFTCRSRSVAWSKKYMIKLPHMLQINRVGLNSEHEKKCRMISSDGFSYYLITREMKSREEELCLPKKCWKKKQNSQKTFPPT